MAVHVGGKGPGHLARVQGGWNPAFLGPSLLGAWDAERSDLITLVGSAVSSWRDVVAGYDAAQATGAARPAYSGTSFNGRPGLTLDGHDDELTFAGVGAFPVGSAGGEIWVLLDQTALPADTTTRTLISYGGAGLGPSRNARRMVVSGVNRASATIGDGATGVAVTNGAADFSGRQVVRIVTTPTETITQVTDTSMAGVAVVPATGTTRTRIGANTSATPGAFGSGVLNYIAITAPLSTDQAASMLRFLKARAGLA